MQFKEHCISSFFFFFGGGGEGGGGIYVVIRVAFMKSVSIAIK